MNSEQYNDTKMRLLGGLFVFVVFFLCLMICHVFIALEETKIALATSQSTQKQISEAVYAFNPSAGHEKLSMRDITIRSCQFVQNVYTASESLRVTTAWAAALTPFFFKTVGFIASFFVAPVDFQGRILLALLPDFIAPSHLARDVVEFATTCAQSTQCLSIWLCGVGSLIVSVLRGKG